MTPTAHVPLLVLKEVRALGPLWAVSAAAVCAGAVVHHPTATGAAMLAFTIGSIALGAQSIGQEYTHRTLPVLLAQPRDRRVLLAAKLGVLAPMLIALATLAWWFFFRDGRLPRALEWTRDFPAPVLIVTSAFFLAPWFTMIARNPLAGIVFTFIVPPCLLIAGDLIGGWRYGFSAGAPIDKLKFALVWYGTLSACAIGGVAGWRTFMRLEAIEGAGHDLHLPSWRFVRAHKGEGATAARTAQARHPIRRLIAKELRLQQLTFVLVVIYVVALVTMWLTKQGTGAMGIVLPLTVIYSVLLSVMIGSLACAEERQFGTHDVHLLLPFPVWKQWIIKAGVALALALVLGFVIPEAVALLSGTSPTRFIVVNRLWAIGVAVIVLTSGSLYVSTLCSSGVRAAVMALPAYLGTVAFVQLVSGIAWKVVRSEPIVRATLALDLDRNSLRTLRSVMDTISIISAILFAALLLSLAYRNYRSSERNVRRVVVQLLCLASLITAVLLLETFTSAVWMTAATRRP